jgi:UDP-N-acetylmuramoyl-tripeptide--D-alanyl-D-alanine ligase
MIMARLLEPALTRAAKQILDTHRPLVVGIAGSVGKTSAKDAVACVLRDWTRTMSTPENQNDELGVPLSVIGARPSGRNPFGWLATLRNARRIGGLNSGSYPDCLVLEFGSCHVGDIEYLMRLSEPTVGVLTALEATHLDSYDSLAAIELEEGKVVTMLPPGGAGVVNLDNPGAASAASRACCRIVTYGFGADSDVRGLAAVSAIDWDRRMACTHLHVQVGDRRDIVRIEGTIGRHSCYAPLAALAVAQAMGMPFEEGVRALRAYIPPAGRMRCRPGLNGSLVIDDAYNSSPAAAMKALDALGEVASGDSADTIAVIGPMAELGSASRGQHEALGRHAAKVGLGWLVTVGDETRETARAARDARMPAGRVLEVARTEEAVAALRARVRPGSVVLVKGSQSSRLERVAAALAEVRPIESRAT